MSLRFTEEEYASFCSQSKVRKNAIRTKQPPTVSSKNVLPMAKEKEGVIQNRIRDFLRYNGWYVIRHQQSLGSLKGLSDLSAIKNGVTIYVEVKTPRGHQSEYQKEFQEEIEAHGGIYILARSIEDVKKVLCKQRL